MGSREIPGTFQQEVLKSVMRLRDNAYGVTLRRDLSERLKRDISYGALYVTLERLESKGFLSSKEGGKTDQRGGRAKRFYAIEAPGLRALEAARAAAIKLLSEPPEGVLARGLRTFKAARATAIKLLSDLPEGALA